MHVERQVVASTVLPQIPAEKDNELKDDNKEIQKNETENIHGRRKRSLLR